MHCLDRIHTNIALIILARPEIGLALTVALLELVAAEAALLVGHLAFDGGEASVVFIATVTLA